MSKTVKRALWQRTLETAGPLRKPLPVAPDQALEGFFCRMQAIVDRGEERRRLQAKRETRIFGMELAAGGVRDQTGVCLVGERGPELFIDVRVNTDAIEAWLADWQRGLDRNLSDLQTGRANFAQTLRAMQIGVETASKTMAHIWVKQMVQEISEDPKP